MRVSLGSILPDLPLLVGPVALVLGAMLGNLFALITLLVVFAVTLSAEDLMARAAEARVGPDATARLEQVATSLAYAHFGVQLLALLALGGATGLGFVPWLLMFFAFVLYFGQVSTAAAHWLIHSPDRGKVMLGNAVYASMFCATYGVQHRFVHHRFVATIDDPMTAGPGEGFWMYAQRAWLGGLVAGWEIQRALMKPRLGSARMWVHPYILLIGAGVAFAAGSVIVFGASGLIVMALVSPFVRLQLSLTDYVGHYGMQREKSGPGKYAPLTAEHCWEAPRFLPPALLPRQPRMPDHQAYPPVGHRHLQAAPSSAHSPAMQWPIPIMAFAAMVPPLWEQAMRRRMRSADWQRLVDVDRAARRDLGADQA